ncbi:MAG: hypothetical protein KC468_12380 [Myxococcales bacterium]|nr:hypothetical protein [Myxococcales bacterium]
MTAPPAPPSTAAAAGPLAALPRWLSQALGFIALGLLIFGVLLGMGAAVEAPTVALALAGVALVFAVWRMFAIVHALAVPHGPGVDLERVGGVRRAGLEDEFQRLLRSIKELEFDHEMGKISDRDFEEMETNYRARAIEVMRGLEQTEALHPELQRLLALREEERSGGFVVPGLQSEATAMGDSDETVDDGPVRRVCAACDGRNDADAKFCKHCGKELAA